MFLPKLVIVSRVRVKSRQYFQTVVAESGIGFNPVF